MTSILEELRELSLPKLGAFAAGAAAATYIIYRCVKSDDPLLMLLALTGAIAGWVLGVLAAPFSTEEKQHFSDLAKVISGFVTGYLLSKADPLIDAMFRVGDGGAPAMSAQAGEQLLVTLSSFGIALLFVFNARLYWSPRRREGAAAR